HYVMYIKLYGTTDNYNTEYTERLHIDLAKDAYRATNFKDEFPQMTLWLERKEKIFRHEKFIKWKLDGSPAPIAVKPLPPGIIYERTLVMTKHPTSKSVKISCLIDDYGATSFRSALARFIVHHTHPNLTLPQLELQSNNLNLPFNAVPVYSRIKFTAPDPYTAGGLSDLVIDAVHVQPARQLSNGQAVPARFDTVLVNDGTGALTGVKGYRVGQVRVVFTIPKQAVPTLFPSGLFPPKHLAYIEWFSPFGSVPEPHHLMYKIKRSLKDGERLASIVPVVSIRRSVHLLPKFGPIATKHWTSSNVLEEAAFFFVNSMTDRHIYATLF
ncbi:hypothetical protein C8J57DRAFT_1069230, partial [Mycena rebaudengoi]